MIRTLEGFLKAYCRELSGLDTTNLRKLVDAAKDNARLVEPLFALAAVQDKADYLVRISKGTWFHNDYVRLARMLESANSLEELFDSGEVSGRYASVLDAYRSQDDDLAANRRIIGLIRPKIAGALKQAGVTRYRLCRDLGLNIGNVYAYLAGDDSKVSKATAREMLCYAESCAHRTDA